MVLTVALILSLGLAGLLGAQRGVRAGLVALGGTLLAAALIELWAEALVAWVLGRFQPTDPALPTFLITGGLFALIAVVVGYGGEALLLPDDLDEDQVVNLRTRSIGTLLGVLNAALALGYLLRYMLVAWPENTTLPLLRSAPLADLLLRWLPGLMLALVAVAAGPVLVRWSRVAWYQLRLRQGSVAAASNLDEADRRLLRKINRALGRE